jgi:hypothetical protein
MEYITTSGELKMWDNLLDKLQLETKPELTPLEQIGLTKLVAERLTYIQRKAKELYLLSLEGKSKKNVLDRSIDEEIKLTIIQSKLQS